MGSGIAYASALRGLPVLLNDTSLELAERGKSHSASLSVRRVERGQMSIAQREQLLARITPSAAIDGFCRAAILSLRRSLNRPH